MSAPPPYLVELRASAVKELGKLPREVQTRVIGALQALATNPRPSGAASLRGLSSTLRVRVGSYRIVCEIDDDTGVVTVGRIRHRREVYR